MDEAVPLTPTEHMVAPASSDHRPLDLLLSTVHCTLLRAGWFVCAPEWGVRSGLISQYILWLGMGGAADVVMDGVRYHVGLGDVLLMPPGVHRQASHDPASPFRVLAAHFTARVHGVLDLGALYPPPRAMRPPPTRLAALVQTVERIVRELTAAKTGTMLAINGDCARLVALLWREAAVQSDPPLSSANDRLAAVARLAPVLRLIETRYAERLTLAELAGAVHLDPAYFSTVFKGLAGLPPIRYLTRYRLDRVRELLLTTDLTIAEIAARTGFRDPFYLSHAFHHAEGVSPSAYRRTKDFAGL
ncbi:MAG: AraC family transcriptional regulator [Chloroflexota bacterium]